MRGLAIPTGDGDATLVLAAADVSPAVPESVELLDGGEQAYPRMLAAIASAMRTVHLQVYAFAPGGVGKRFVEALALAADRGVAVEVWIDGWGSARGGRSVAAALREAGCTVRIHNRMLSLLAGRFGRNHRKVLLVDDEVAFLGGINIGDENLGEAQRVGWADLALEIRGPQCMRLGQMIRGEPLHSVGGSLRIFLCGLGGGWRLRRRYLDAFASARERIHVAHGYFLPDPGVVRAITAAARRGVQVRLLLAGQSNHPLARAASRSLYPRLLSAGVSIHEWSESVLHAKVATVDGRRLLVGSFNLDPFSLANLEALVEVDDIQVVEQGEAWIQDHIASSRSMTSVGANSRLQKWLFYPLGRMVAQLADAASRVMASRKQRKASPDHSRSSRTPHRALARWGTRAYPDSRRGDVMDAPEPLGAKIRSRERSRFSRPGEVVDSQILARAEKRALLLQWLEDEKALLVADDEGMQGDRPSQIDLVHRALRVLEK
jgi:cardiolipin synthase